MTLDPTIVAAALALLAAMGGLLMLVFRSFASGSLHPRSTVPREDYEALRAINATYPVAIRSLVRAVKKLAVSVDRIAASNGKERP
jgi:hypothetical protein